MSLGYAEKLSYKKDVGAVGMSEVFDSDDVLQQKIEELVILVKESKHLVVFTGAGISTSCGIPDFRGPTGIWTLQKEGKDLPKASLPFHRAMPSLTHMALVELERVGILKFLISQNVDSLHLRSGIPREKIAELHGNSFRETCSSCGLEYIRDFEIETIGMKETSRRCSNLKCGGKLIDTVLDWEDALPPKEMNAAVKHCKMADVVLCLGTSLQITPACNFPLKCLRGGGKIVIVNLQPTPKDKSAALVIRGFVDKVISAVMKKLYLQIPPFVRIDLIQLSVRRSSKRNPLITWTLRISSVHGQKAPLPFIKSVEVCFPERSDFKTALLKKQPFLLKRKTKPRSFNIVLKINLIEGCGCPFVTIEWPVDFQVPSKSFDHDTSHILHNLRASAIKEGSCGQLASIKRTSLPSSVVCVEAIVTNFLKHDATSREETKALNTIIHHDHGNMMKRSEEANGAQSPSKRFKNY